MVKYKIHTQVRNSELNIPLRPGPDLGAGWFYKNNKYIIFLTILI